MAKSISSRTEGTIPLLSQSQNRKALFARYLVSGKTQVEAAQLAGWKQPDKVAYKIARDPFVVSMVEELTQRLNEESVITAERHLKTLAQLRDEARERGQISAAVAAEVSRGKVGRLYVAQTEDLSRDRVDSSEVISSLLDRVERLSGRDAAYGGRDDDVVVDDASPEGGAGSSLPDDSKETKEDK